MKQITEHSPLSALSPLGDRDITTESVAAYVVHMCVWVCVCMGEGGEYGLRILQHHSTVSK
jgi:hypothetical protein